MMGQVITFYSYKGGVGRSMALANIAVILSSWGLKTLMIDWDLEAPGLENFFREYVKVATIVKKKGILEYLTNAQENGKKIDWQEYVTPIKTPLSKEPIHLMPAGKRDAGYFKRLREFDVSKFYGEHEGGKIIERLRNELKEQYDYILVDSRTGVTDVGGICTIQMPDILVLLFTPTEQGLNGIKFIADSARKGQQALPATRKRLLVFPVPTRIDSGTEFKISQEWIDRFAKELASYYDDWLPADVPKRRFIEHIKLPYISYFSYGEKLPVIEQGMDDRGGLGFAFENLAALLANRLEDVQMFIEERDDYINKFSKAASHPSSNNIKSQEPITVFISYARTDEEYAKQLREVLSINFNRYGIVIWDERFILPGQNWERAIISGITNADVIFVLLDDDYLSGLHGTKDHLTAALQNKGNVVIPIYLNQLTEHTTNPLDKIKGITFEQAIATKYYDKLGDKHPLDEVFALLRVMKSKKTTRTIILT